MAILTDGTELYGRGKLKTNLSINCSFVNDEGNENCLFKAEMSKHGIILKCYTAFPNQHGYVEQDNVTIEIIDEPNNQQSYSIHSTATIASQSETVTNFEDDSEKNSGSIESNNLQTQYI